jgi:hypothetical protein
MGVHSDEGVVSKQPLLHGLRGHVIGGIPPLAAFLARLIAATPGCSGLLDRRAALRLDGSGLLAFQSSVPTTEKIERSLAVDVMTLVALDQDKLLNVGRVLSIDRIALGNRVVVRLVHPVSQRKRLRLEKRPVHPIGAIKPSLGPVVLVKQGDTRLELRFGLTLSFLLALLALLPKLIEFVLDPLGVLARGANFIAKLIISPGTAIYPFLGLGDFIFLPIAFGVIPALVVDLSGIGPFIKPFVGFIFDAIDTIDIVLWVFGVSHNVHPYRYFLRSSICD